MAACDACGAPRACRAAISLPTPTDVLEADRLWWRLGRAKRKEAEHVRSCKPCDRGGQCELGGRLADTYRMRRRQYCAHQEAMGLSGRFGYPQQFQ